MGVFMSPVDHQGHTLGNPPLHVHHVHYHDVPVHEAETDTYIILQRHIFGSWHGDGQCHSKFGGTDCMLQLLPEGYAFKASHPLSIDSDYNDVRPVGSKPLRFWVEFAAKLSSTVPKRVVAQLGLYAPHFMQLPAFPREFTFMLPGNRESVLWYSVMLPSAGVWQTAIPHQHQYWAKNSLIFAEWPGPLGLLRFPGGLMNMTTSLDVSHDEVLTALRPNMIGKSSTLICESGPQRMRLEYVDSESCQQPYPCTKMFDRGTPMRCTEWHMQKGDVVTVVNFHVPMRPEFSVSLAWQHAIFHVMYLPDQPAPSALVLLGSENPVHTWHSHIGNKSRQEVFSGPNRLAPWDKDDSALLF